MMDTKVIKRWQQEERDKQQQKLQLKLNENMTKLRQQSLRNCDDAMLIGDNQEDQTASQLHTINEV